jgi:nitrite reductase/ring-hydroxylating ferredoxin subunit
MLPADLAVGPVAEIPQGSFRIVEARAGLEIGVTRVGDEVFAVRNVCPHQAAPVCLGPIGGTMLPSEPGELEYGLERLVVRCPWHAWEFSLRTGEHLFTGERGHLRTYPVEIRDGEAFVRLRAH